MPVFLQSKVSKSNKKTAVMSNGYSFVSLILEINEHVFLCHFCAQAVVTDVAVPISRLSEIISVTKCDLQESGLFGNNSVHILCWIIKCTDINGLFVCCLLDEISMIGWMC